MTAITGLAQNHPATAQTAMEDPTFKTHPAREEWGGPDPPSA